MKLAAYKKHMIKPLRPRTLVFLMHNNSVLLGLKKKGFGKGNWLGIGGKVEHGESIEYAAKREMSEEVGITVSELKKAGVISFYFPHIPDEDWNQEVHVFLARTWEGEPTESEEMKPQWYPLDQIPYEYMWEDAKYWLPDVLDGKRVTAEFMFDERLRITDKDC